MTGSFQEDKGLRQISICEREGSSEINTEKCSLEFISLLVTLKTVSLEWWLQKSDFNVGFEQQVRKRVNSLKKFGDEVACTWE